MTDGRKNWLRRHQALSLVLINLAVLAILFFLAEIILRFYVTYNPGYYTSIKTSSRELTYPWGKVPINSDGYPDEEFELGEKQRIGYIGDSVNFGVGAGYGNRISEILERTYPQFNHWNFGGIGEALSNKKINNNLILVKQYKLNKLVYIFNLNDIIPDIADDNYNVPLIRKVQIFVWKYLDWLRGKSYVYTYFRTHIKNYLVSKGFESHGYEAAELFPSRNINVIAQTAQRINKMSRALREIGVEFYLVILPYEMQISDEAARIYAMHNIKWEDGFLEGSTQQLLIKEIDEDIIVFNAYYGFVDPGSPRELQKPARAGELYVYNRGDKMDWNHPTAKGHRVIADYLIQKNIFNEK